MQIIEQHMLLAQTLDRVQRCLASILAAESAQVEPALHQAATSSMERAPRSIARTTCRSDTAWHEQTMAMPVRYPLLLVGRNLRRARMAP